MTHHLVAADNGSCFAQAIFTVNGDMVHVLALIGATRYIDKQYSREEARQEWRNLVDAGWTIPVQTPVLKASTLRLYIYN